MWNLQLYGGGLVTKSCQTLRPQGLQCPPQAPLSMGFSRQEYWSGLPLPSPGDLPDPGIELGSPALQEDSLPTELRGKPSQHLQIFVNWVKRILHFQHGNKWMMLSTQ